MVTNPPFKWNDKIYLVTIYFSNLFNTTCSIEYSKRNETTIGSTKYHDVRTEVDMFDNKDILVEQELPTLPGHLSSPPVFSRVHVTISVVLCVCFVDRCMSVCTFFRLAIELFDLLQDNRDFDVKTDSTGYSKG
jgi:hypothetical protein